MYDLTTERKLWFASYVGHWWVWLTFLTCHSWGFVQPGFGRRPVDWCRNEISSCSSSSCLWHPKTPTVWDHLPKKILALMLLAANLVNMKWWQKAEKWQTMSNGYSSDSSQWELSNEYQHDRVKKIFIIFWHFVLIIRRVKKHFWKKSFYNTIHNFLTRGTRYEWICGVFSASNLVQLLIPSKIVILTAHEHSIIGYWRERGRRTGLANWQ